MRTRHSVIEMVRPGQSICGYGKTPGFWNSIIFRATRGADKRIHRRRRGDVPGKPDIVLSRERPVDRYSAGCLNQPVSAARRWSMARLPPEQTMPIFLPASSWRNR